MPSEATTPGQAGPELAFVHLAPSQEENGPRSTHPTIIFLHGSESCHLEFSRVVSFLRDSYEMFLVDLPGHTGSKEVPFSFDAAVNGIALLIKTHVEARKAHIVGMSLGGFIGLEFARRCPDLVSSLWCTGCAPFGGYTRWFMSRSLLLSGVISMVGRLSNDKMFWASFGDGVVPIPGLREEVQKNQNITTLRPVFDELVSVTLDSLRDIEGVRIALIAGGKRDDLDDTVKAGEVLREKTPQCNAYVVREAIHWWSLQLPEVFANGVRAWVEGNELPVVYEQLLADAA